MTQQRAGDDGRAGFLGDVGELMGIGEVYRYLSDFLSSYVAFAMLANRTEIKAR